MYNAQNELALLMPDIADRMADYVGIQLDVDDTRVKAACLVAQDLDISFVITKDNWNRCFEEIDGVTNTSFSEPLYDLIIPVVCFFTYSRLVAMMQGNYTDSGMSVEEGALSINEAKSASKQYRAIGESYLGQVVDYLENENSSTKATMDKSVMRVRSIGGDERPSRGSGRRGSGEAYPTWPNRASK